MPVVSSGLVTGDWVWVCFGLKSAQEGRSTRSREHSWPPAALTRRIVNRFGSNELLLLIGRESYNGPLIGWWFPGRAPSLWSSLQLVAQAAKLHPLCRKQLEAKKLRWQLNVRCCANKSFKQIYRQKGQISKIKIAYKSYRKLSYISFVCFTFPWCVCCLF